MGVETGDCNIIPEREYHTYLPTVFDGNKRNVDSNKLFGKMKEISNVVVKIIKSIGYLMNKNMSER